MEKERDAEEGEEDEEEVTGVEREGVGRVRMGV